MLYGADQIRKLKYSQNTSDLPQKPTTDGSCSIAAFNLESDSLLSLLRIMYWMNEHNQTSYCSASQLFAPETTGRTLNSAQEWSLETNAMAVEPGISLTPLLLATRENNFQVSFQEWDVSPNFPMTMQHDFTAMEGWVSCVAFIWLILHADLWQLQKPPACLDQDKKPLSGKESGKRRNPCN